MLMAGRPHCSYVVTERKYHYRTREIIANGLSQPSAALVLLAHPRGHGVPATWLLLIGSRVQRIPDIRILFSSCNRELSFVLSITVTFSGRMLPLIGIIF